MMSEKLKGSLSAIIDGEADEFELRRVLDEIDKNADLRSTWERYHLIGARIRGERIDTREALRQRVWDALDFTETEYGSQDSQESAENDLPESVPKFGRWTGIAVAATVAIAIVVGFNTFNQPVNDVIPVVVIDQIVELAEVGTEVDIQRQDAWMIRHAQLMGMNQQGFTSFIKMATYGRQ